MDRRAGSLAASSAQVQFARQIRVRYIAIDAALLHPFQVSLVYINTLRIQRVLQEPGWANRLTAEDRRALTPRLWGHINPHGLFRLDMNV
jgi:hypothetical protein